MTAQRTIPSQHYFDQPSSVISEMAVVDVIVVAITATIPVTIIAIIIITVQAVVEVVAAEEVAVQTTAVKAHKSLPKIWTRRWTTGA